MIRLIGRLLCSVCSVCSVNLTDRRFWVRFLGSSRMRMEKIRMFRMTDYSESRMKMHLSRFVVIVLTSYFLHKVIRQRVSSDIQL